MKEQPAAERMFRSEAAGSGASARTVASKSDKPAFSGINFQ